MLERLRIKAACLVIIALFVSLGAAAPRPHDGAALPGFAPEKSGGKSKKKSGDKAAGKKKPAKKSKAVKVRWGQRAKESNAKYDKRYKRILKKIRRDKEGDFNGGPARLWTYMGHPFIVRTDIGPEFTADAVMYMEMLHRDYGEAYRKLLGGVPAQVKEPIEVIIFKDRAAYAQNGGSPGSGGQFMTHFSFQDRGPYWKAKHYRLMQFTDGISDFSKWPKGVLKHEAAHMEMRLRLGMVLHPAVQLAIPVDSPRWFDEGQASVFEYWDFDKSVDENFAEIPNRGRYAPVIRRIHATDRWKNFDYVWKIDPQTWHADMTSDQGFLNYAQAWSLAAYMAAGGVEGRKDFRAIFNLSKRVGADRQTNYKGDGLRAWDLQFSQKDRDEMEKNWNKWVGQYIPRDKKVRDEDWFLRRQGFKPEVIDKLESYTEDELKEIVPKIRKEETRRRKAVKVEK